MKLIQKMVLPAAITLAGLSATQVWAAGTDAGTTISNEATLSYTVNGSSSNATVSATADFKVDVKINFNWDAVGTDLYTATATDFGGTEYFVTSAVELTNSSNTKAFYALTVNGTSDDFDVSSSTYSPTATTSSTAFKYVLDTDGDGDLTEETVYTAGASGDLIELAADSTSYDLYVLVPSASVTATDGGILGVQLNAAAAEVLITGNSANTTVTDDSGSADDADVIQFVYADTSDSAGNTEIIYSGSTLGSLPDFTVDPTDPETPSKSGIVKSSVVVWDPFTGTRDDTAGVYPKAIPGAIVKYTITVTNNGTGAADTVTITDPVPTATTFCNVATADTVDPTGACLDLAASDTTALSDGTTDNSVTPDTSASTSTNISVVYGSFAAGYTSDIVYYVVVQ